MGRNYFSKHGGPLFINNGLSRHIENTPGHDHKDIEPLNPIYGLLGVVCVLLPVCVAIVMSAIL